MPSNNVEVHIGQHNLKQYETTEQTMRGVEKIFIHPSRRK